MKRLVVVLVAAAACTEPARDPLLGRFTNPRGIDDPTVKGPIILCIYQSRDTSSYYVFDWAMGYGIGGRWTRQADSAVFDSWYPATAYMGHSDTLFVRRPDAPIAKMVHSPNTEHPDDCGGR